jgi:hypothetical protein
VQGLVQPFKYSRDRRLEYFNQAVLFVWCYYMYIFTDFVPDAAVRYTMGYHLIVLVSFCILVNLTVINMGTPYRIKKKFYKKCKKYWVFFKEAIQGLFSKKRLKPGPGSHYDRTGTDAAFLAENRYPISMDINELR